MTHKLDTALALASRGFKVFPIKANAKTPPLVKDWPNKATTDEKYITSMWSQWPDANVGIHCDGMIVVDVDVKNGGAETLQFWEINYGIPDTLKTITPSGGYHLFFRSNSAVSNTVGRIGRGIDIRSHGGYVLAPNSSIPTGRYRFAEDVGIADVPEWLLRKIGQFTERERAPEVNIPDATDDVVMRARQWLSMQTAAIQGRGGDHHTFTIACGLRDRGVSAEQAIVLLAGPWNERCQPPWTAEDLVQKVKNAYRYAENEAGSLSISASDFPINETSVHVAETRQYSKPVNLPKRLSEVVASAVAGPGYLVKGLLNRKSQAVMYGAPGEGKTFVALDLAYHIAAGKEWMGRKVNQGLTLYLAYEGVGGFVRRAMALRQHYGQDDVPLYIHSSDYNLRDLAGRKALGEMLGTLPEKPALIVIDTLARAMKGGDENSAQDMGALMESVGALSANTGACVMIVHHSGKNKAGGARGSSALLGAIDTEIEVDERQINSTKQRDIEMCDPIGFDLKPLLVGMDDDGDNVTSCVVIPAKIVHHTSRISGNVKRAWEVLCERWPDNRSVNDEEWAAACSDFLPARRGALWDVKRALVRAKLIVIDPHTNMTARKIE